MSRNLIDEAKSLIDSFDIEERDKEFLIELANRLISKEYSKNTAFYFKRLSMEIERIKKKRI